MASSLHQLVFGPSWLSQPITKSTQTFEEKRQRALSYVKDPLSYLTDPLNFWVVDFRVIGRDTEIVKVHREGFSPGDYLETHELRQLTYEVRALMRSELHERGDRFRPSFDLYLCFVRTDTWMLHANCRISVSDPNPIAVRSFRTMQRVIRATQAMEDCDNTVVFVEPEDTEFIMMSTDLTSLVRRYASLIIRRADDILKRHRLRLFTGELNVTTRNSDSFTWSGLFAPPIQTLSAYGPLDKDGPVLSIKFDSSFFWVTSQTFFVHTRDEFDHAYTNARMFTEVPFLQKDDTKYYISHYDIIALLTEDKLNEKILAMVTQPRAANNSITRFQRHPLYERQLWNVIKQQLLPEKKMQHLGRRQRA
jgi:hypothetical protein